MHNHKHHCICTHENIKYCKKCQRPYCVDCGMEWYTQSGYYTYANTYPTLYRSNTTDAVGNIWKSEQPAQDLTPTITCSHES